MRYSMRHFRQTHASYRCAKRKQKRTSVDIANDEHSTDQQPGDQDNIFYNEKADSTKSESVDKRTTDTKVSPRRMKKLRAPKETPPLQRSPSVQRLRY
jgi:hypothetical protein